MLLLICNMSKQMKKYLKIIALIFLVLITISGCREKKEEPIEDTSFHYVHDPRENPEAMKDIIEDPDAVYGFSPDPDSTRLGTYADYDWSDPEFVAQAKA